MFMVQIRLLDILEIIYKRIMSWKIIEMIRLMKHGISWRNSTSKILQRYEEK